MANFQIEYEKHTTQKELWRTAGFYVILAQYTEDSVIVYQAYNEEIARYAVEHQKFEGAPGFSSTRMTWIKTNFLWMMYRSGWGAKKNQTRTLAIWLKRPHFEAMLRQAEHTIYDNQMGAYQNKKEWQSKLANSTIRIQVRNNRLRSDVSTLIEGSQWDPDHSPAGGYPAYISGEAILHIADISNKVKLLKQLVDSEDLETPKERAYEIAEPELRKHLCLDQTGRTKPEVDVEALYQQAVADNHADDNNT